MLPSDLREAWRLVRAVPALGVLSTTTATLLATFCLNPNGYPKQEDGLTHRPQASGSHQLAFDRPYYVVYLGAQSRA